MLVYNLHTLPAYLPLDVALDVTHMTLKSSAVEEFRQHGVILPKVYCGAHQLSSTVLKVCRIYPIFSSVLDFFHICG